MATDPDFQREAELADARMLHELMCACAERAFARAEALGTIPPEESVEAVRAKRRWLDGELDEAALASSRSAAALALRPGNPVHLGAAALATIWMPRSGLTLMPDEAFAERITRAKNVLEAALLAADESVEAVVDAAYRVQKDVATARAAGLEERTWQRERLRALRVQPRPLLSGAPSAPAIAEVPRTFAEDEAAILPVRDVVPFPSAQQTLFIGRPPSLAAVQWAQRERRPVLVLCQRDPRTPRPTVDDLYAVGTLCELRAVRPHGRGALQLIAVGLRRARLVELRQSEPFALARYERVPDVPVQEEPVALAEELRREGSRLAWTLPGPSPRLLCALDRGRTAAALSVFLGSAIPLSIARRQALLEEVSGEERARRTLALVQEINARTAAAQMQSLRFRLQCWGHRLRVLRHRIACRVFGRRCGRLPAG